MKRRQGRCQKLIQTSLISMGSCWSWHRLVSRSDAEVFDRTTRKPVRMIKNDMKAQKAVRPHLSSLLTHISVQSKSL